MFFVSALGCFVSVDGQSCIMSVVFWWNKEIQEKCFVSRNVLEVFGTIRANLFFWLRLWTATRGV